MRLIYVLFAVLALSACTKQAETSVQAGVEFRVDKLFTVDGCTVYRFVDGGYNRYFTNCKGAAAWNENCGKGCSRVVSVEGAQ